MADTCIKINCPFKCSYVAHFEWTQELKRFQAMKPRRFRLSLLNALEILEIVCCSFNDNTALSLHLCYFLFSMTTQPLCPWEKRGLSQILDSTVSTS
jgi:hypothetical protein